MGDFLDILVNGDLFWANKVLLEVRNAGHEYYQYNKMSVY